MITQRRELGNKGEEKAAQYLIAKGYSIVERNWATRFGEIDIIAKKRDGAYVFVEVKTIRSNSFIRPEENITPQKLRRFLRAVEIYLGSARIPKTSLWQVDAIAVSFHNGEAADIRHWENINIF